jgi:hypothetical protein
MEKDTFDPGLQVERQGPLPPVLCMGKIGVKGFSDSELVVEVDGQQTRAGYHPNLSPETDSLA